MLVIASVIDIKKREIPDKIWLGFGGFGIMMAILEALNGTLQMGTLIQSQPGTLTTDNFNLVNYLLGIGIIAPIAYGIYRTGLYGGADSKAIIVIAVLIPPSIIVNLNVAMIHGFSGLTVLTNAVILSLVTLCYNTIRNSLELAKGSKLFEGFEESTIRKALAFAVGFRTHAPRGYLYSMESIDEGSGKRKFIFNPGAYEDFVGEEEHTSLSGEFVRSAGAERVWVTQALPFIVYIAGGFIMMLLLGDFMALLIQEIT